MLFALAKELPTCALGRNSFTKNRFNELHQGFFKQLGIKLPIDSLCCRTPFLLSLLCVWNSRLGALGAFLSDKEVSAECEKGVRGCSYPL